MSGIIHFGGYLSAPYEVSDGRIKMGFLGTAKQIKRVLQVFENSGPRYKVVSLTDAKFSLNSPLSYLTDKQRKVLITAHNLGYYDVPRRIRSDKLASILNIRNPTFVMHRRKAEKRLLDEILKTKLQT